MKATDSSTILIVSESGSDPDLNLGFLQQPDVRLLYGAPEPETLVIARDHRPDLIIEESAVSAPEAPGLWKRLKLEPATQRIPLILVHAAPIPREQGAGVADVVLHKPLVPREFYEVVRRFVALPTRRNQRYESNVRFNFLMGGRPVQAFSRDLSANGAFLKTDRLVALGTHLELRFYLPDGGHQIVCGGRVRDARDFNGSGLTGLGVEFEGIRDADLERLEAFLRRQDRRSFFSMLLD